MGVVVGEGEAVALAGVLVVGLDRVLEAAGLAHDGQGAVAHGYHLGEAAGLKAAGHEQHVRAGVDAVAQLLVVADVGADASLVAVLRLAHEALVLARAAAQQQEADVEVHHLVEHALYEVEALLRGHARDHCYERGVRVGVQTHVEHQRLLAGLLALEVTLVEALGDERVGEGVEGLGVDAVYDAAELVAAGGEYALQTLAEVRGADLVGVAGADGAQPVGEDAAGLQEGAAAVELHELGREVPVLDAQQVAEKLKAELALIGDVVDGEQGLHPAVDVVAVLRAQQHGDHGGVPVVAVQDVGEEAQVGYGVEHGAREEGVLLALGHAAAVDAVAEVVLVVDEVDGHAVDHKPLYAHVLAAPAEVDRETEHVLDLVAVPVLHTAVIGGYHARVYAERREALGQGPDNVGEAAGLGYGRALGAHEQYGRQTVAAFVGQSLLEFTFHCIPSFRVGSVPGN